MDIVLVYVHVFPSDVNLLFIFNKNQSTSFHEQWYFPF